ncbi:MFS general substrate transporter [Teratosphaeria nubilosa]|uniref:MFS general substrate transporter n=1 Tax=Teratosphaeria nubilosa TaxID=161662 RepID=A0A6G1L5U4_9PEZI|nr:MFS general substrate transporter [Teratosphaeria nubilosa]
MKSEQSRSDSEQGPELSQQAQHPSPQADPPPDGGIRAWLQVLGSFILFFNTWGIVNTFGVFQTYYSTALLASEPESNISWIGSIQAFLLLIVGVATGPLFDAGYFEALLCTGAFLIVFGMYMTSLCTIYWQIMLAQGLCVGLGCGCLFIPSVAIVSTYFTSKKSFATGIAASGSSLGGVIYPIVFQQLQPQIGFRDATIVLASMMAGTMLVCIAVMRVRNLPPQARKLFDLKAFRETPYLLFSIGEFLGFMGLYIPFFYLQSYSSEKGIMGTNLAFYMLPILNAASIFGRVIPNFLADKTGPLNMLIPCSAISALLAYCWIAIDSKAGVIVFAILYGFFSGTFVSLPPTTVVSLSPSLSVVGTRMGMSFAFAGFGILVGNPVAGAILTSSTWLGVQLFCATSVAAATTCVVVARLAKSKSITSKA